MNKDQVAGRATEVKGKAKKAVGELTDSERLKREGQVDKAIGQGQAAAGDAKEKVKKAIDKA